MAYEKGVSIWEAKNELTKLRVTMETIQAVLNDAENKQEGSHAVKNWIRRLKEVLYDAEDFFDQVLTEDLVKRQMKEENNNLISLKNKVRISCSMLNPVVSRNSIAKKVKIIRGRLAEISTDMAQFGFVPSQPNNLVVSTARLKYATRCYIGEKSVIGRDEDRRVILEMLSESAMSDGPLVIAIEGIGGMGKTTLAHLIYNAEEVKKKFENRWFACIADTSDEKEVLGKIYQSICGGSYSDLTVIQLQERISGSVASKKYLLVLDDVWEDHRGRWENRKSMLSSGATGSKIIVTTRLQPVVRAMGAVRAHRLKGLSEHDSWKLFESLAFDSTDEKDVRKENVGRKLLERCRGVPLAIWCMGSLLHNKTIQEWEEIDRVGLPAVGECNDEIMSILKLSYGHLPSNLKQCFTYCSLFPKDWVFNKEQLIYHWIAQGYIDIDEEESSFMHLLRMGFFQEAEEDKFGEIWCCKMHDIMHDLALHLSGDESIMISGTSFSASSCTRYMSLTVNEDDGGLLNIPTALLNVKSMRSCMFIQSQRRSLQNLDQVCLNFKLLRTLTFPGSGIKHIPPSIGELKLVRYLDFSYNEFEELPDSITSLVNLCILQLTSCRNLKAWPRNFKKLINLCCLESMECYNLKWMPEGIGEMDNLRYLGDFWVRKWSELDVLNGLLKQLRGKLEIRFCEEMEVEGDWSWQLPAFVSLQLLDISSYPGQRIQGLGDNETTSKLQSLYLKSCKSVKYLPPLKCLSILKRLDLSRLPELEFVEVEDLNTYNNTPSKKLFFPCLKELNLDYLPKLKGWWGREAAEETSTSASSLEFSCLSKLRIKDCPNLDLNSFPLCPQLQELVLANTSTMIELELSFAILCPSTYQSLQKISISSCKWLTSIPGEALVSLRNLAIKNCSRLESLQLASPHLLYIVLEDCAELTSIELCERPSLQYLEIGGCKQLKSFHMDEQPSLPKAETRIMKLENMDGVLIEWLLSPLSSLRVCDIAETVGLESLQITSPHLQLVSVSKCVGLTRVEVESPTIIHISCCLDLKNFSIAHPDTLASVTIMFPPSTGVNPGLILNLGDGRCITELVLGGVDGVFMERLLSSLEGISLLKSIGSLTVALPSLREFRISDARGLKNLNFKSQPLRSICIESCDDLTSVEVESPLLPISFVDSFFTISRCSQLKNVRFLRPVALGKLQIRECPELSLSTGVDWNSLTNLDYIGLHPLPPLEELQIPQHLLQRHTLGLLKIEEAPVYSTPSGFRLR